MKKYRLNKLNVVKETTDERIVEQYKQKGFKVISEIDVGAVATTDDGFVCTICNQTFKKESYFKAHMTKKHPELKTGGEE